MKILTLKQKDSNSGSIHDIESNCYEREIKFRNGKKFAVVASSYYGDLQSSHKTVELAMSSELAQSGYSTQIIDTDGGRVFA